MGEEQTLATTREFWDANPCGVHADYAQQKAQRYAMEPWIPAVLDRIAKRHTSFLEVGCGQGIDSTLLCAAMPKGAMYVGIDYSPRSVEVARYNADRLADRLGTKPEYRVGNAEKLDFADSSFEAVYSLGVIHHTADERAAIREVHRVLKPGGTAYIFLYRKLGPKVAVAKILRAVQSAIDSMLGTDRCIYRLLSRRRTDTQLFGTMFHECFGVPYMKWFSRREIERLFSEFSHLQLKAIGPNLGRFSPSRRDQNRFGYFWQIEVQK